MMRKCHLNTCPVGIATQDPLLRKKFSGKPEYVVNFFFLLAEEIREYLALLGDKSIDELIGRTDFLEIDQSVLHYKNHGVDLSALLVSSKELTNGNNNISIKKSIIQNHQLNEAFDNILIEKSKPALDEGIPVIIEATITNLNRTVGTMLSYEISKKFGAKGLPENTINIKLNGHGGQSLGFALAKGITIELEGDSNDYVGKSLSGGNIIVYPSKELSLNNYNYTFIPQDNVIVGNVCLYGATSGKAFFCGKAGERFAVRNSGALTVVEGVGDHGCEYMTGGKVIILGEIGRNFGAGMSGGVAYVYDPTNTFASKCNLGTIGLEKLEDINEINELRDLINEHIKLTNSILGSEIMKDWNINILSFVKVMPHDYKRVLLEKLIQSKQEKQQLQLQQQEEERNNNETIKLNNKL